MVLLIAIWSLLALDQIHVVRGLHNGLSEIADPWTESDTLRAAEGYAAQGFTANWGLPDLCYGRQFPDEGTKGMLRDSPGDAATWLLVNHAVAPSADRFVYTHYPPGPHLIAGAMTAIWGTGHISRYRSIPIAVGLFAIAVLFSELWRSLGPWRAVAVSAALAMIPMFSDMMHGLSYQGYALALLLIECAIVLRVVRGAFRRHELVALLAVAFIQGWLGFDYVFLVVLAPVVITPALGAPMSRTTMFMCCVAALGFGIAHLLHFVQVALYLGGPMAAIRDFVSIGRFRALGSAYDNGVTLPSTWRVLADYLVVQTALPRHFGVSVLWLSGISWVAAWALERRSLLRGAARIALALLVSSLWVAVMPQYAAQHWHFIPRHYFLAVFAGVLGVAAASRTRVSSLA